MKERDTEVNRRLLIIANTYYQLILAVQMRLTIFCKDEVILLLSNHSTNSEKVLNRLSNIEAFSEAHYIKTKGLIAKRNGVQKAKDFFDIILGRENRYSFYLDDIGNRYFDEIICFNYNIDIIGIYSLIYRNNISVKVSLFEEGILSYGVAFEDNIRRKTIRLFRKVFGKKDISDSYGNFYCFYPQLYSGALSVVGVPAIASGSECSDVLKSIFSINESQFSYSQKFIYFSSVYDFEGGAPIGELELVKSIGELVGKENLLVKTHPRDIREIYEKNGFSVDKNSSVPWEVIQLTEDFSDKVFLTATSGSVLAGSFMSDKPVKTIYLYNLCDISNNISAQETAEAILNLLEKEELKDTLCNVKIAKALEDIIK